MQGQDFPALYRSADDLSLASQRRFFQILGLHLAMLVVAAILSSAVSFWIISVAQFLVLVCALGCSIFLLAVRPDRLWYAGRAVAESIKTVTWRYACRAEPFQTEDAIARHDFSRTLREIIEQNREVCQSLTAHLGEQQFTPAMEGMRTRRVEERQEIYANMRIKDQLAWYAKKAVFNRDMSKYFFWALVGVNFVAVACAALRIREGGVSFWPTDILVATAASLLSWMQAKRYSELAASYALAAHEISLIKEKSMLRYDDDTFSVFVSDSENAFSREHTQWVARRDI